jgi:hypothetical protein
MPLDRRLYVYYDDKELYPTPLINYSYQPINFGYIYGYNTEITLEGIITGIDNKESGISEITGIFAKQFSTLKVENEKHSGIYQWNNVTVDNISFEQSQYLKGSFVKYNVKCFVYDIPSGVIDPSNEYSFTQNEDGTVNVNHKISARGVRNNLGAFQNAINFVKSFTGKDPFSNCVPYFVPSGSGVLLNLSENINRADGIYSVTEVYKYNTGVISEALHITSLDIDESLGSEYSSISYNLKVIGSPIYKNTDSIISNYLNYNLLNDIQNDFGLNTSGWVKNTYSAAVDSGAATIDIKVEYLSGANPSGFFDYVISCDKDHLMGIENWKIEGEFKCFGPLDYKINQLNAFKSTNKNNSWRTYLINLITNSQIYNSLHDVDKVFSINTNVNQDENLKIGALKLSLTLNMGYEPDGLADLKYSINGSPSKWIYELMPSVNIEGAYVVQSLETKTNGVIELNVSAKSLQKENGLNLCNSYINNLANTYIDSGNDLNVKAFLIEDFYSTGTYDVSYSKKFIGNIKDIDSTLVNLQCFGTFDYSVPTRIKGYNFGY